MAERRKDSKNRVLKECEYERDNGTYEYKWRDKRGRRHSIYAQTLDELRRKEDDVNKDILIGLKLINPTLTVNDIYYRWCDIKRGLKENTFSNYKYMYSQFVEQDLGCIKIKNLKHSDIRAFYNMLYDERNLKTQTIDSIHNVIHQVLQLAVEDDLIRINPSDNALKELKKAHNSDISKRHALTVPEQELFEEYLKKHGKYQRWYPIFIVMLWTGMRVGEITGLRWIDVDFEKNEININHTLVYFNKYKTNGMSFAINTPKTKAGNRVIPMLPKVKEALLMEKAYQEECGIECKTTIDGYTDFIFVNSFGGVQNQGTLNKALRRIIRDCNYSVIDRKIKSEVTLPPFSNHILRHTFATRMCEAGINIKAMQEILGHSDAETTMNIYAEATKNFKNKEMTKLDDYFNT